MSFEDDVKINKYKLDVACEEQPCLILSYEEPLASLKGDRDRLYDRLNLVTAELELEIRKNPPEGVKLTEGTVKSLVLSSPRVTKIQTKLNETKKEIYQYEAAVNAFEHRKRMLDNLVKLWTSNYYSDPDRYVSPSDEAGKDIRGNLNKERRQEEKNA